MCLWFIVRSRVYCVLSVYVCVHVVKTRLCRLFESCRVILNGLLCVRVCCACVCFV